MDDMEEEGADGPMNSVEVKIHQPKVKGGLKISQNDCMH